ELGEPDHSAVTGRGHNARSPSRARLVAYPSPPLPRGVRGNGYGMRVPCPAACYSSSPPLPWWERGRGVRGGPSECRELLQRGADLLRGGQVGLLQRRAEGHGRYLRSGDAHNRPIEVGEGFLGDERRDLCPDSADLVGLVDDQHLAGLGHRLEDRLLVQRAERTQVDDLDTAAVLLLERFGRGQRLVE